MRPNPPVLPIVSPIDFSLNTLLNIPSDVPASLPLAKEFVECAGEKGLNGVGERVVVTNLPSGRVLKGGKGLKDGKGGRRYMRHEALVTAVRGFHTMGSNLILSTFGSDNCN